MFTDKSTCPIPHCRFFFDPPSRRITCLELSSSKRVWHYGASFHSSYFVNTSHVCDTTHYSTAQQPKFCVCFDSVVDIMADQQIAKIDKLTSENYATWSFVMEQVLKAKGFWNRVQPPNDEAYVAAAEVEQRAMSEIVVDISSSMMNIVVGAENARAAWQVLKAQAEDNSAEPPISSTTECGL